eukprot:6723630-Prymnesium_polylepis.1
MRARCRRPDARLRTQSHVAAMSRRRAGAHKAAGTRAQHSAQHTLALLPFSSSSIATTHLDRSRAQFGSPPLKAAGGHGARSGASMADEVELFPSRPQHPRSPPRRSPP